MILRALFWTSLGGLAWTHAGYPLAAASLARLRPRPVRKGPGEPTVTVVVPAHDEEDVIERRVENLRALDYPEARYEIVVASDGSTDRTGELAQRAGARVLQLPRNGKTAALDAAVRASESEVVAFTDANALWAAPALRKLVRNLADPDVAYVCGQLRLDRGATAANGASREGVYWRYELWLRESESTLGSITAGNGAIYAVRRADYVEADDPRTGHDFFLPLALTQRGRRAVYEPEAVAWERPAADAEAEYGRKVRMFARSWQHVAGGRVFRTRDGLYLFQLVSHRALRYASGLLHVTLLGTSAALAREGGPYAAALGGQLAWLGLAEAGRRRLPLPGAALSYYYLLVTWATLAGLARYLRTGAPQVWEKAEGTR
jgi:cellulose synthase/poly-beta-1,6-N-acetylglucosamine synthase-like glycosyltransferase